MKYKIGVVFLALLLVSCQNNKPTTFIVGSYTDAENNEGLSVYEIDFENKQYTLKDASSDVPNPSFLTFGTTHDQIFAVSEQQESAVYSLSLQSEKLSSTGKVSLPSADPCHISYSDRYKNLLIANYTSGSFTQIQLDSVGKLTKDINTISISGKGKDIVRQLSSHAHAIYMSPWYKNIAYGVDLGTDQIITFQIDDNLSVVDRMTMSEEGSGVRHLAFHPTQKWIYAVNELTSTISLVVIDQHDQMSEKVLLPTTQGDKENYPAEVQIHPSGKYLYVSNRGEDTIAIFDINQKTGELTARKEISVHGNWPRFFMMTRDAKHLLVANQESNNIVVFPMTNNGDLQEPIMDIEVYSPVCILEK